MEQTAVLRLERMQCMEIWGGNQAISKSVEAPGINVYVHSAPYQSSQSGGGDIYYVTSCASGRITRMLLADVSGHGESVSGVAKSLRDLLRASVNKIRQDRFIESMNREFSDVAKSGVFATAAVVTYFEPRRQLTIGLAGHPYPLYYRASKSKWVHLDPKESEDGDRVENLPLGIMDETDYPSRHIDVKRGDLFILYSDAYIEAIDENGKQIGTEGMLQILNSSENREPEKILETLRSTIAAMNSDNLRSDDETLILGQITSTKVRFLDNLLAPFRLLRQARDRTSI